MSDENDMPLVSVVIPAYNEGPLLAEAIESVLAQSYSCPDPYSCIEVVVVNDGSTDPRTRETCLSYAERLIYIEQENGGVAAARNTGVKAASGSLIALLDQDDRWLPHKLETQVRDLTMHPRAVLAHSSFYRIDAGGERTGVSRLAEREWQPLPSLLIDVPIASGTTLMRREAVEKAGGFDPEMPGTDDWDLWLRMAAHGGTFFCNSEPLAEYREHSANTSRNLDLMIRSTFRTLDKFYSMPQVPAVARPWRARAYAHRHTWAAVNLYATGSHMEAHRHVVRAARRRPKSVTSLRFLRAIVRAIVRARLGQPFDLVARNLHRLQHVPKGNPIPEGNPHERR
jgi:glycosyltransferase involved in cell wall biosynthesis